MLIIIIRTLILYITVILSLRAMGKRQIGELQPSELVVAIMISDLASVPMQAIDIPLVTGIIPVLTLMVSEVVMSYIGIKSKTFRRILSGEPSIIIYKGVVNEEELKKQRFNLSDLLEELRLSGGCNINDVDIAVLETNGKLSVIQKNKPEKTGGLPCLIISDGRFSEGELKRSGLTKEDIYQKLRAFGIYDEKDVFIASIDDNGEMFLQKKKEKDGESK